MNQLFKIITALLITACFSCNQQAPKQETPKQETMVVVKDSAAKALKTLAFASKKDLVCGMPVSAGVHDTASYKGKLYGFCATECKEEFLKDPKGYLTTK